MVNSEGLIESKGKRYDSSYSEKNEDTLLIVCLPHELQERHGLLGGQPVVAEHSLAVEESLLRMRFRPGRASVGEIDVPHLDWTGKCRCISSAKLAILLGNLFVGH